jgi:hypothetical protein
MQLRRAHTGAQRETRRRWCYRCVMRGSARELGALPQGWRQVRAVGRVGDRAELGRPACPAWSWRACMHEPREREVERGQRESKDERGVVRACFLLKLGVADKAAGAAREGWGTAASSARRQQRNLAETCTGQQESARSRPGSAPPGRGAAWCHPTARADQRRQACHGPLGAHDTVHAWLSRPRARRLKQK